MPLSGIVWRMRVAYLIIATGHVLAGAAWFGAMLYSLLVVHPRSRSFFGTPRQFENFITHIAAGARWKVLGGAAFIGLTGVGLLVVPGGGYLSNGKLVCIAAKSVLFCMAVGLFCFASWKLWPARVLASDDEIVVFQRRFRAIAISLLLLVAADMVLGILCSHL